MTDGPVIATISGVEEPQESRIRRLVGVLIEDELNDGNAAVIGHAMRWLDGAGQKTMIPTDDPTGRAIAALAMNAAKGGTMPELDTETEDQGA